MLDTFLPRRVQVSGTPPPMSRTSSSSSSSFVSDANSGDADGGVSLMPLTTTHDDDHLHNNNNHPERSLRQRATSSAVPSQQLSSLVNSNANSLRDDESLSNSEDDESKGGGGNNGSNVLRSVLGASPFLMGPHIFSPSELGRPPRGRKASDDTEGSQTNPEKNPSFGKSKAYRRVVPQSPLMDSPAGSTVGSSFSDVDLENNVSFDEVVPLASPSIKQRRQQQQPQQPTNNNSNISSSTYQRNYAFVLRSRENIIIHFLMEAKMLRTDLLFILFATFYQFFHSAVTNVAYLQHAHLSAANRVPLRDVAFDVLPALDGEYWIVSEYIAYAIVGTAISCIVGTLVVKWNAPHGRPIYAIQINRRMGMVWIVCMTLRMISFLVTTLPGASRQCRYALPAGLTSEEMLNGPAPDEGNPVGWAPPTDLHDVLFRVDASNGCGDLMFSSHTIYTMTFVCVVYKYFNFKWLKRLMVLLQIAIVPFILAARKHYTVDVFTALYVTPLVFEILWTRFPDRDTSADLARYYGIRFYLAQDGRDSFGYVVSIWGREFYVDPEQLPIDIIQGQYYVKGPSLSWGKGGESTRSAASIV